MAEVKVPVLLSKKDAELFMWFRKYQDIWEDAKTIKPGRLVLHFDSKNCIKKHDVEKIRK